LSFLIFRIVRKSNQKLPTTRLLRKSLNAGIKSDLTWSDDNAEPKIMIDWDYLK
jgi:hypothetical protein